MQLIHAVKKTELDSRSENLITVQTSDVNHSSSYRPALLLQFLLVPFK